jgi:hypothetical protein
MAMTVNSRIALDSYVVETLLPDLVGHDRRPTAFLVYLIIAAEPDGRLVASNSELAERAGVSRRGAQDAVAHLARRGLIEARRRGATEAAEYRAITPWRR